MKRAMLPIAILLAVGAIGLWVATGAHRGWSKTSVPVKTLDEITGIESIAYEKKFIAGLDFLGACLLAAGGLATLSVILQTRKTSN